mgnify:FL=1
MKLVAVVAIGVISLTFKPSLADENTVISSEITVSCRSWAEQYRQQNADTKRYSSEWYQLYKKNRAPDVDGASKQRLLTLKSMADQSSLIAFKLSGLLSTICEQKP